MAAGPSMAPEAQESAEAAAAASKGGDCDDGNSSAAAGGGTQLAGGELMLFDDGSMTADKAQSSAMSLVINYTDPAVAAGAAVFGLGLLVLPLLSKMNNLLPEQTFRYKHHGETNPRQPLRLFTEAELRTRFGPVDAETMAQEITMSTDELDEHMEASRMEDTDDEVSQIQKWRDFANANLRSLQKRSALAFLGLPPEACDNDINRMYKKMALELHPDKGGDPEKFQELQEMKERLSELEKGEDGEKKKGEGEAEDPEEDEAKKAKDKEEEQERQRLPPSERIKKLRMDVHDNSVRLWERARKSKDEIVGEKALKCNAQPVLNILRLFVDRFVSSEIKTLRHDDVKGAEAKLRKFVKQGAEILAVAALSDVQATLATLAMHFNYRLIARSGSAEIREKCAALLEAVGEVPRQAEALIQRVENGLADQKDRDRQRKEQQAADQRQREARGDFGGEASSSSSSSAPGKGSGKASAAASAGPAKAASAPKTAETAQGAGAAGAFSKQVGAGVAKALKQDDPFGDFDFGEADRKSAEAARAKSLSAKPSEALATTRGEDDRSAVAAALKQQKRTCWDPNFDHPYAGALKSNGTGIYCRPCQRWIVTYEYSTEVFLTHVERVHPKPPPGWSS
ncbi:unnamed protein product [Polarella glacialis]|uniref:J domain-containing protein n=1 Tax=Polarella glacialis TaxID=89957 RepID=A0A813GNB8_POLGL|nr:unnamed protein product [Polarella glacialis]